MRKVTLNFDVYPFEIPEQLIHETIGKLSVWSMLKEPFLEIYREGRYNFKAVYSLKEGGTSHDKVVEVHWRPEIRDYTFYY